MWAGAVVLLVLLLCEGGKTRSASTVQVRCIESERQALLKFKQGLEDYYDTLSSWTNNNTAGKEDQDCCRWRGIKCHNRTNHVIVLHLGSHEIDPSKSGDDISKYFDDYAFTFIWLPRSKFGGEIGSSLVELVYLRHLDLSFNDFTKIPKFIGSFTRLRYLNLGSNPISGTVPPQLGNLTKLRFLCLESVLHELTAENLEWLPDLSSLTTLKFWGLNLINPAADWLQSIQAVPSLSSLELIACNFAHYNKVATSTLSHKYHHLNYSNTLIALNIRSSTINPRAVPWLLNVSSNLINLTIRYDTIRGMLPNSFENMRSLENIDLKSNRVEGGIPKSFGNLCNLKSLDLSYNHLNGTLHDLVESLSGCTAKSLQILRLQENELGHSLPDLSQFLSLRQLHLAYNKLNGSLSESIGQLSNLEILTVSSNYITGVVSEAHMLNLYKLKKLCLSLNSLTLNLKPNWVPPFQLFVLKLGSCKLGTESFPSWLQTQLNLVSLDVSNCGISDTIPHWFYDLITPKLRYLNLSSNSIKSNLPKLPLTFDNYPTIDLSSNQFHGSVPISLANATALYLSNNTFTIFQPFSCTIIRTQRSTAVLDLSNNNLYGSLPDCWMHWKDLVALNLENNKLSGAVPASFGSLHKLKTLRLRNNSISGNLASSLRNCTHLLLLDIGENNLNGKVPTLIGEYLTDLVVLRLRSNKIYGSLPSSLCQLGSIQILDLSLNVISGAIPSCFQNFTSMAHKADGVGDTLDSGPMPNTIGVTYTIDHSRGLGQVYETAAYIMWKGQEYMYDKNLGLLKVIDLSNNRLTGKVPKRLTNLVELGGLNLSRNRLSGSIPESIGKMKLEFLDLSHNRLSGKIPISLANISSLAVLDLSDNELWGKIPTGTQLQGFDPSKYSGNVGLCGPPLNITCCDGQAGTLEYSRSTSSSCGTNGNVDDDDDHTDGGGLDMSWFHRGIGVGFAIGFSGTFGLTLFLNTSWIYMILDRCLYMWDKTDQIRRQLIRT